jgi:3-isopropylmalate dehydratase large subunit
VAMAMAGKPYYIITPQIWGIHVKDEFQPFVSGKDLILKLLGDYTAKAGIGKIIEFYGPGLKKMDMAARATIANMSVDMGFTACIFPSDEVTHDYLRRNSRPDDFRPLTPDKNAEYDKVTEIRLNEIEPMVAYPSNPDNVKPARELAKVDIHQVIIGSSCNGDFRDFMIAAKMVGGK